MYQHRSYMNFTSFSEVWDAEKLNPTVGSKPSLLRAYKKVLFWNVFLAAPLLAIQNVSQISLPVLLGYLIDFMVLLIRVDVVFILMFSYGKGE